MPGWILGRFWATAVVMLTLALGTAVALWGAGFLVPGGTPPTTRSQPVQAPAAPPQTAPSPLAVVGPQASPAKPAVPEKKPERPVDAGPKSPQGKPAAARTGPPVVEGRILDLEGRPIAGATVRVEVVQRPRRASSMRSSTRSSGWASVRTICPTRTGRRRKGLLPEDRGGRRFWRDSAW